MPHTLSIIELLWIIFSAVNTVLAWWLYERSSRIRNYWQTSKINGSVNLNTKLNKVSALVLFWMQFIYFLLGIASGTYPPRPNSDLDPDWLAVIPSIGLLITQIMVMWLFFWSKNIRERLVIMEAERKRREILVAVYGITGQTTAAEISLMVEAEYARDEPTVRGIEDFPRYLIRLRNTLREEAKNGA